MKLAQLAFGIEKKARKARSAYSTPWIVCVPAYAYGVLTAYLFSSHRPAAVGLISEIEHFPWHFICVVAALLSLFLCHFVRDSVKIWLFAWFMLWASLGNYRAYDRTYPLPSEEKAYAALLEVVDLTTPTPQGRFVDVRVLAWRGETVGHRDGRLARLWLEPEEVLDYGAKYTAKVKFRKVYGPDVEGAYNAKRALREQSYSLSLTKIGLAKAWAEERAFVPKILDKMGKYRETSYQLLMEASPNGLQPALAMGLGQSVETTAREQFARLGLAHVLSVSGFHFSLIATALLIFIGALLARSSFLLRRFGKHRMTAALSLPLLAIYLLFVGSPIPAQRALIMTYCVSFARIFGKKAETMRALTLAALIIILQEPYTLFSISFLLSFIAVLGLVLTLELYDKPLRFHLSQVFEPKERIYKVCTFISSMLLVCVGTTLASAPILISTFQQIPFLGMLSNLWVLPYVSFLLLPAALLFSLLGPALGSWSLKLYKIPEFLETLLIYSVEFTDQFLPLTHLRIDAWYPIVIASALLAIFTFLPQLKLKHRLILTITAFVLFLSSCLCSPLVNTNATQRLRVSFISVGQADATLLELPNGQNILIDAGSPLGSTQNSGNTRLLPYLSKLKIKEIDLVIITHPDYDHFASLEALAGKIIIKELWHNGQSSLDPRYQQVLETLEKQSCRIKAIQETNRVQEIGEITLERLWPPDYALYEADYNANEQSIVLSLKYNQFHLLLMGDAGKVVEHELLQNQPTRLAAHILKAGHHGSNSASSTEFLKAVNPNYIIFSLARNNRYRFPSSKVIERVQDQGAKIYRHDWHGSIRFTTNGTRMFVESMRLTQ